MKTEIIVVPRIDCDDNPKSRMADWEDKIKRGLIAVIGGILALGIAWVVLLRLLPFILNILVIVITFAGVLAFIYIACRIISAVVSIISGPAG